MAEHETLHLLAEANYNLYKTFPSHRREALGFAALLLIGKFQSHLLPLNVSLWLKGSSTSGPAQARRLCHRALA